MDTKSFGKKLKYCRFDAELCLMECAHRVGISQTYYADIERGTRLPKLETFVKMLNVLSASADDVLQDSLSVGYEIRSNAILAKLESLDLAHRKQALEILDVVVDILKG